MIAGWLGTIGHVMERHGVRLADVAAQAQRETSTVWSQRAAGIAHRFVEVVRIGRVLERRWPRRQAEASPAAS